MYPLCGLRLGLNAFLTLNNNNLPTLAVKGNEGPQVLISLLNQRRSYYYCYYYYYYYYYYNYIIIIYHGEVVGTRPIGRPKKSWLEGVQDVLNRQRIKTSINKRAVQAKVMKLKDAQVECQDRARWRKV